MINEKAVKFDMMDFEVKRNHQFFSGNTLSDVDISEKDTEKFFQENREYFKPLVKAHVTKICSS